MTSSKKLVDKYQYNESQVRSDGLAQLITAKHIVLKEYFTLKKLCISNQKTLVRYHAIMNEMNVLKHLTDKSFLFKCHKMLKTSNNLYIVYDLIGKNPTLASLLETKQLNSQAKKKNIALQILRVLKQLKSLNIFYLDCNMKLIEVDECENVKLTNLENAIFSNKNTSSLSFLNVHISSDLAPELKEIIEDCCALSYEKDIDFTLFNTRLSKVDLFAFGRILGRLFENEIDFNEKQASNIGNFQKELKKLLQKLASTAIHDRPSFEEIQNVLMERKMTEQMEEEKNPNIRISMKSRNRLDVSHAEPQMKKSKSLIKSSSNSTAFNTSQFLSPGIDDDFDTKSVRSSKDFTDSTNISKLKIKKRNSSFQVESEQSYSDACQSFVLKVMKRRNLCRFLLNLANTLFGLHLVDRLPKVMLVFLLVKKSVLLICSLARYISTGKGESEEFYIRENARKQFAKTNDFFRLSVAINKEMDTGRTLYQNMISQFNMDFSELTEIKEYNFNYECKSENLNEKFMKQLVRKSLEQILRRLENPSLRGTPEPIRKTLETSHKTSRNYLHLGDQSAQNRTLRTTGKSDKSNKDNNLLDIDDITSVVSARTVRTKVSRQASHSGKDENFQNQNVLRNIEFDSLINVYMMGLILDFETYEKMFQNLIDDEKVEFLEQSLIKKLRKMQPKHIAQKMSDMLN